MAEFGEREVLEEMGLTENEARVYLALLETGTTTAGVIVKKTKLHRSTTYEVIRRLIETGMISYVIKAGKKHFEATDPGKFLDMMKEREEHFRNVLPGLKRKKDIAKLKQEAYVYEGRKGVKTIFEDVLKTLDKGGEYLIFGAGEPTPLHDYLKLFEVKRSREKIPLKIIFSEGSRLIDYYSKIPYTEVKVLPKENITPSEVEIYGDKTAIILWGEKPMAFVIENKEVADSFRKYFNLLWERDTLTLKGKEGIIEMCEQVLRTGKDVYLIGANGWLPFTHSDYFPDFEKRRVERGITRHHVAIEKTRGTPFSRLGKLKVRYLPREFSSPMVIWVFGDYVAQVLWDEQIVFMVKNRKVAKDYRKYFRFLWRNAKP